MNRAEFIEEVRLSPYYTKDFEKIFQKFETYQNLILDALRAFHQVCSANKISYQLAYGSLLGAIRDNGQIPWDYDIDVFVPYSEKEKLIQALHRDLNDEFYFYCPEVDSRCRHYMMRIAPKGYSTELFHLDIFYLIGTPEDSQARNEFAKEIEKLAHIRYYKFISILKSSRTFKHFIKLMLYKFKYLLRDVDSDSKRFEYLCNKYPLADSTYATTADIFATWYDIPTEYLLNTHCIETDEGEFYISSSYEKLLRIFYKDFRTLPPLKSRIDEFIKHYKLQSDVSPLSLSLSTKKPSIR